MKNEREENNKRSESWSGVVLLVAKGRLEVHASTQPERVCVQHGFVIPQHIIRIAIRSVGCFGLRRETGYALGHVASCSRRGGIEAGHV